MALRTLFAASAVLYSADAAPGLKSRRAGHKMEWQGVFDMTNYQSDAFWRMQKKDGEYADESMLMVFMATDATAAAMVANNGKASGLLHGSCPDLAAGQEVPLPTADGACYNFKPDLTADDSTWKIKTETLTGLSIYTEHVPLEFERDIHYFTEKSTAPPDDSDEDIEPVGQGVHQAEYAGIFNVPAEATWLAQKVDGAYADPMMKIVLLAADTTGDVTEDTVKGYTQEINEHMTGDSCEDVAEGGTMTVPGCYVLNFDQSKDDSRYTISTGADGDGTTGVLIAGEHVPLEFERDTHYLQTKDGEDIEAVPGAEFSAASLEHTHGDGESTTASTPGLVLDLTAHGRRHMTDTDNSYYRHGVTIYTTAGGDMYGQGDPITGAVGRKFKIGALVIDGAATTVTKGTVANIHYIASCDDPSVVEGAVDTVSGTAHFMLKAPGSSTCKVSVVDAGGAKVRHCLQWAKFSCAVLCAAKAS